MDVLPFFAFLLAITEIYAAGFILEHDSIAITSYDHDRVENATVELFQYNKTSKAYNISITFKQDVPADVKVGMILNKLQGDTYRSIAPQFAPNVCDLFARNEFGIRSVYQYSNFRGCPIKKNINYYVANFMLSDDKLPPTMVTGKFRVDVKMFSKKITYATVDWFVGVAKN